MVLSTLLGKKELGDLELRVHQFILQSVSVFKRLFNPIIDGIFYLSNAQVSELSSSQSVLFLNPELKPRMEKRIILFLPMELKNKWPVVRAPLKWLAELNI